MALDLIKSVITSDNLLLPVIKLVKCYDEWLLSTLDVVVCKLLVEILIDYGIRHLRPSVKKIPPDNTRLFGTSYTDTLDKILFSLRLRYLRSKYVFLGVCGNKSEQLLHLLCHKSYSVVTSEIITRMENPFLVIHIRPHLIGCDKLLYGFK
jgi:hypothetical protein